MYVLYFSEKNTETFTNMQSCFHQLKKLEIMLTADDKENNVQNIGNESLTKRKSQIKNTFSEINQTQIADFSLGSIRNTLMLDSTQKRQNREYLKHASANKLKIQKSQFIRNTSEKLLKNSISGLIKTQKSEDKRNDKKKPQPLHFRLKKISRKNLYKLENNQKYFQDKDVEINENLVQNLGLYEASNLFKRQNVQKFIKEKYQHHFKPVINLKFLTLDNCNRNQFFFTNTQIKMNQAKSLLEEETQNIKKVKRNVNITEGSENKKYFDEVLEEKNKEPVENKKNQWILTVNDFKMVKNENYGLLKAQNIQNWGQISYIFTSIQKYLLRLKTHHFSFKFETDKLLKIFPMCRKINPVKLNQVIKIRPQKSQWETIRNGHQIIKGYLAIWREKTILTKMRELKKKKQQFFECVAKRMIVRHRVKKNNQRTMKCVEELSTMLMSGNWNHDVEIYIPSFSESEAIRNGTQYMENFQNLFFHIWKNIEKETILILPAVNETILSFLKAREKLSSHITIICPETHELYPKSLPLSACLLYSNATISKLKAILDGKRGLLIPGRNITKKHSYQMKLSHILNCPIYTPLDKSHDLYSTKSLLSTCLPSYAYEGVQKGSQFRGLIEKVAKLISDNSKVKVWILKINGEFNGRGIAYFEVSSSQKLMQIVEEGQMERKGISKNKKVVDRLRGQIRDKIVSYLKMHFRMKIRVNFQNSIYRTDQFLNSLLKKGGVIEEFVEDAESYECFYEAIPQPEGVVARSISLCQNHSVCYVNRSAIFNLQPPQTVIEAMKKVEQMLMDHEYIGYISVNILYSPATKCAYGLDIKCHYTFNSVIHNFIHRLIDTPTNCNSLTPQIPRKVSIPSISLNNSQLVFLFIPTIIFPNLDQLSKCELIQNLTLESWEELNQLDLCSKDGVCSIYLSLGLSLGLLFVCKEGEMRKMKKEAVENLRVLSQRVGLLQKHSAEIMRRDVFQLRDIIRSITSIK